MLGVDDGMNDMPMDIGQPHIASTKAEGGTSVIQTHQIEHGGVQVVYFALVGDGAIAPLIGRSMNHATANPSPASQIESRRDCDRVHSHLGQRGSAQTLQPTRPTLNPAGRVA